MPRDLDQIPYPAPKPRNPGRWRFDAPTGEFPVTYGNVDKHHVFVEVYGDTNGTHEIAVDQADRRLSFATVARPLKVVDLGHAPTLARLGVDGRIATTVDYLRTQLWGAKIREWCPLADAIRYPGRKAGRKDNFCLFLDRCGGELEWTYVGKLSEQRDLVLLASDMFNLVPSVVLRTKPTAAWP